MIQHQTHNVLSVHISIADKLPIANQLSVSFNFFELFAIKNKISEPIFDMFIYKLDLIETMLYNISRYPTDWQSLFKVKGYILDHVNKTKTLITAKNIVLKLSNLKTYVQKQIDDLKSQTTIEISSYLIRLGRLKTCPEPTAKDKITIKFKVEDDKLINQLLILKEQYDKLVSVKTIEYKDYTDWSIQRYELQQELITLLSELNTLDSIKVFVVFKQLPEQVKHKQDVYESEMTKWIQKNPSYSYNQDGYINNIYDLFEFCKLSSTKESDITTVIFENQTYTLTISNPHIEFETSYFGAKELSKTNLLGSLLANYIQTKYDQNNPNQLKSDDFKVFIEDDLVANIKISE